MAEATCRKNVKLERENEEQTYHQRLQPRHTSKRTKTCSLYILKHTHTHARAHTDIYIYVCVCMYVYIYIYIVSLYIYIHMHI